MKKLIGYILVICTFWSCEELMDVENISDKHVELLAPIDNATLNSNILTFTWNPVEGAEKYHLQIAQPSFNEALQIVRDTLVYHVNFRDSLNNNTYQWRIRAVNAEYTTVYTTNTITIE